MDTLRREGQRTDNVTPLWCDKNTQRDNTGHSISALNKFKGGVSVNDSRSAAILKSILRKKLLYFRCGED